MANTANPRFDEPIPYVISELGEVWMEGQDRVCGVCGVRNFPKGYVYGDDRYCPEHRPEHFTRDFREQQRRWDEEGLRPDFDCYWTEWETVEEVEGKLCVI